MLRFFLPKISRNESKYANYLEGKNGLIISAYFYAAKCCCLFSSCPFEKIKARLEYHPKGRNFGSKKISDDRRQRENEAFIFLLNLLSIKKV